MVSEERPRARGENSEVRVGGVGVAGKEFFVEKRIVC